MCTALCASGTALFRAQKTYAAAQTTTTAELVAPSSYEQYLALNKPTAVAATENYTAIADDNLLYVFDRESGVYLTYTHTKKIESVQFDENGNLYFLSSLFVYRLSLSDLKANTASAEKLTDISCTAFLIEGGNLYYTTSGELCVYSLSDQSVATLKEENQGFESVLAFGKDGIYYISESAETQNAYTVYAINLQTNGVKEIASFSEKLRAIAVESNLFCATTQSGDFYSFKLSALNAKEDALQTETLTKESGGYSALCAQGGNVYAVRNNGVRCYSVSEAAFTEYEITSSSPSSHRFSGASETLLNGDRLFIADEGNERISVYNTQTESFEKAINSTMPSPYLASYENTLLVASQSETVLYGLSSKNYGNELFSITLDEAEGEIVGVASVYGRYYVLTNENYCYMLSKESGAWAVDQKTHKNTETLSATAFTADVYGMLYIACDDDAVYRFTEEELLSAEADGKKVLENLQNPEKISVDYESNLYALSDGVLNKYTQNEGGTYALNTSYTPSYGLVKDETPHVVSFAFGLEDEYTYLLYEGDYIVKTDELQIPKVNPIPVGNAVELIYGETVSEFSAVTVQTDSILIEFDLSLLQEASEFPYVAFARTQKPQTALKIGETGEYSIVATTKARTGKYCVYLVLTSSCAPLQTEYKIDYESAQEGYLTNDVSLYKFPYLNGLLTVDELPRGSEVKLLGEVLELDHAYYKVLFTDENGNEKIGYIPKSYATLFDGSTPTPETVISGATETDTDAVWRCVYIILGFGAIAILVDLLILHKPKENENE